MYVFVYSIIPQTGKFKANSGILGPCMKGVNPHDEIKGSNPSPYPPSLFPSFSPLLPFQCSAGYNYLSLPCSTIGLVYSIHDSTEVTIQRKNDWSNDNDQQGEGMSPPLRRHLELEIKTLQNAPRRDAEKLERLLRLKERQKEEAMHT
jgi:hypothetical protein